MRSPALRSKASRRGTACPIGVKSGQEAQVKAQGRAGRRDPLPHCRAFRARELVHADDAASSQLGHETLRQMGSEPVPALRQDGGAALLDDMSSPVLRVSPRREEAVQPGKGDGQADLRQLLAQLTKRESLARFPHAEDVGRTPLDPVNPA